MNQEKYLIVKRSISRGRNTNGYNIVTIWDGNERYSCSGGGYDLLGTSFGYWLWANYKESIQKSLRPLRWGDQGRGEDQLYGYVAVSNTEPGYLDGGCGLECMIQIAERIGLRVRQLCERKGCYTTGFIIGEEIKK
jgi:hypothetical protein